MCFCTQVAPKIPKLQSRYRVEYRSDSLLETRIAGKARRTRALTRMNGVIWVQALGAKHSLPRMILESYSPSGFRHKRKELGRMWWPLPSVWRYGLVQDYPRHLEGPATHQGHLPCRDWRARASS
jgi:hypothetical protein